MFSHLFGGRYDMSESYLRGKEYANTHCAGMDVEQLEWAVRIAEEGIRSGQPEAREFLTGKCDALYLLADKAGAAEIVRDAAVVYAGESRTPIRVGDRYVVKAGSACYWPYATVTAVSPDCVTYDIAFPHGSGAASTGCTASPSAFAASYVWDHFAEQIEGDPDPEPPAALPYGHGWTSYFGHGIGDSDDETAGDVESTMVALFCNLVGITAPPSHSDQDAAERQAARDAEGDPFPVGCRVRVADEPSIGRAAGRLATVVGRPSPALDEYRSLRVDGIAEQWAMHVNWMTLVADGTPHCAGQGTQPCRDGSAVRCVGCDGTTTAPYAVAEADDDGAEQLGYSIRTWPAPLPVSGGAHDDALPWPFVADPAVSCGLCDGLAWESTTIRHELGGETVATCPRCNDDSAVVPHNDDPDGAGQLRADLAHVETMIAAAALTPTTRRVYLLALREIRRQLAALDHNP